MIYTFYKIKGAGISPLLFILKNGNTVKQQILRIPDPQVPGYKNYIVSKIFILL